MIMMEKFVINLYRMISLMFYAPDVVHQICAFDSNCPLDNLED